MGRGELGGWGGGGTRGLDAGRGLVGGFGLGWWDGCCLGGYVFLGFV